jgi:flagellar protein FlaF
MHNNAHTKAAGAYGSSAAVDQRTLEGTILLQAAQRLESLAARLGNGEKVSLEEIGEILNYNQKLWQLFVSDMNNPEHPVPQEIRNNIASLALFIFKRTNEILIDNKPEKYKALVNINRSIAAGLMKRPASGAPAPAQKPSMETSATDSLA